MLDVTFGSGPFMASVEDARGLTRSIVDEAAETACPTTALLTDMLAVLGTIAGNAVEVREAIGYLAGEGGRDPRLREVTRAGTHQL